MDGVVFAALKSQPPEACVLGVGWKEEEGVIISRALFPLSERHAMLDPRGRFQIQGEEFQFLLPSLLSPPFLEVYL